MSFKPDAYGPYTPMGELVVVNAGTGIPLDSNWSPKLRPGTPVTLANPDQYAISLEDIVVNSPPSNSGGMFIITNVQATDVSSKNNTNTILLYIPKGSPPVSLATFLGTNRLQPGDYALDADQDGDKAWIFGKVAN